METDYSYSIHENTILIMDEDLGGKSVTNNIVNVLKDISLNEGINPATYNIAYKDSMGYWDGVLLSKNGIASFYPIRVPNEEGVLEFFKSQKLYLSK